MEESTMTLYLLSIYQPDGEPPPADELAIIARDLADLREELKSAGAWVFAGGLEQAGAARVVHPRRERMQMTDGPYVEAKEHIGGLTIIEAASLDEALEWARRLAGATTLPIEVRPFQGDPDGP
jgi:hypothetical protein